MGFSRNFMQNNMLFCFWVDVRGPSSLGMKLISVPDLVLLCVKSTGIFYHDSYDPLFLGFLSLSPSLFLLAHLRRDSNGF